MTEYIRSIPPRSIIKLLKADGIPYWHGKIGKQCRVGYYSREDGLNIVWLVDQYGAYVETTDMNDLYKWFEVVKLSDLRDDYYGDNAEPLGPISEAESDYECEWKWT